MEILLIALTLFTSHVYRPAKDVHNYVYRHQRYAFWATPLALQRRNLRILINRSIEMAARTDEFNTVVQIQWYDTRVVGEAIADLRKEGYRVDLVETTRPDVSDPHYYSSDSLRVLQIRW